MNLNKIIKQLKKKNQKGLKDLYDCYGDLFFGIALRYLPEVQQAEDAVQETFIKIYHNINSYQEKGSFEGWMKRILVNNCLNLVKKNKSGGIFVELSESGQPKNELSYQDNILEKLTNEEIIRAIQELPTGFRMVLNLYVFEGYSHKEIGEELGISESASRSQLTKARMKLKNMLEELGIYTHAKAL